MITTLPSTSPTQEMTNLYMDTETPNTSNTTQIEFIYSKKGVGICFFGCYPYYAKLQRPMPELLCGVVTENDFESFCDNIDLVLERYTESNTVLGYRTRNLFWIWVAYALTLVFCVFVLPANILHSSVFLAFACLSIAPIFAWITISVKVDCYEQAALCKQVHAECLELTNRTDNATFLLVTHVIGEDSSEYINKEFSHISVLISGNDQLKHNATDDDDATVCTLESVSQTLPIFMMQMEKL